MKIRDKITWLGLASVALLTPVVHAATITPDIGDLILGFHAAANPGQTLNLEVDLGPMSQFYGATPGSTNSLPALALQDIVNTYGASWFSRTDLVWGAIATAGRAAGTPDGHAPLATLWTTAPNGATPWNRASSTLQKSTSGVIETMIDIGAPGTLYGATSTANSSFAAVIDATQDGSWSAQELITAGSSFGRWNPTIDHGTVIPVGGSAISQLYELPPGSGPGTLLGNLVLTRNGLSFQAAPGVAAPVAGFSGSPTNGVAPLMVNFVDSSTGTITNRLWTFGDGGTSNDTDPSHTYSDAGSYSVKLTVFGPGGSNALNRANYIVVSGVQSNLPPVAMCHNVTNTANASCQASVTAAQVDNGSMDPDGTITNRVLTPAGPFSLGNTAVTLTVFDNNGASDSCNAMVVVRDTMLPAITCPANVVTTLPPGQTSANVAYPMPSASDNCSSYVTISTPASGSSFPLGTNTVTSRAIDGSSNTNTCTFQVIVLAGAASNQPPMAICRNFTNAANGSCQAVVAATNVDNGSFDPDGTIVTRTLTPSGPFALGNTSVMLTVIDNQGASNSCMATVTVVDQTPPSVTCSSNLVAFTQPGENSVVVNFPSPVVSDNCSSVTANCEPPSGTSFPLGTNTVTCTGVDAAGNTNQCSFTIAVLAGVEGNQPPVASCRNVTNSADANCQATVTAADVDNGSVDPDGSIVSRLLTPPGPYPPGNTPVTLTVVDNQGASNSCQATVTVIDTTPPSIICPDDVIVSSQSTVKKSKKHNKKHGKNQEGYHHGGDDHGGDDGDGDDGDGDDGGGDQSGNSVKVEFPAPTTSDNCSGVTVTCVPPSGSNFPVGTNTVTCTAVDGAGNTNTCSFKVIVNGGSGSNIPPTAKCKGMVVSAGQNCQATVKASQFDNGSFDPDGKIVNRIIDPPGPFPVGKTLITFTVVDDQGASSSCQTGILVNDTTPPTIDCPPDLTTNAPSGQNSMVVNFPTPVVNDKCSSVTVSCTPPSGSVFPVGKSTVNCIAVDDAHNTNTCSFKVTVIGDQGGGGNNPPVAKAHSVTNSADANCQGIVTPEQVDDGSFDTDGKIASRSLDPPGPYTLGSTLVSLIVVDNKGASNSAPATITVQDLTPPSITCPADVVVNAQPGQTNAVVNYPAPVAADNCSGVSVACTPPSGSVFPLGITTVNCIAVDDAHNTNSCNFKVTVNADNGGNQSPVAKAHDVTSGADGNCQGSVAPEQVDDGSFDPDGSIASRSLNPPGPYPLGNTLVSLIVVDNKGVSSSAQATIRIQDETLPNITCPSNVVVNAQEGQTNAVVDFAPVATDNCSGVSITSVPPSGSLFPIGSTTVNCKAIDDAGNTNSCSFTVTVHPFGFVACDTIAGLITRVQAIPVTPGFSLRRQTSMVNLLQGAQVGLNQKKLTAFRLRMDGFIRNTSILRDFKRIDRDTADELIQCAIDIKDRTLAAP